MKNFLVVLLSAVLVLSLFSCGGDAKTGSADILKEKSDGKELIDCEEFIPVAEEMADMYFDLIEQYFDGDEAAEVELKEYLTFMSSFEDDFEEFADECPEKFKKLKAENDERLLKIREEITYEEWEELFEILSAYR